MTNEISVRNYSISNIPPISPTDDLRASVVGIGRKGVEIVRSLSQDPLRLTCYEVFARHGNEAGTPSSALADKLAQEDLVFLVWEALDVTEAGILRELATASRGKDSRPLLIGVTPEGMESQILADEVLSERAGLGTVFLLPPEKECAEGQRLPTPDGTFNHFETLARYLIKVLTQLNQQRSFIGIDFNDVVMFFKSGVIGRMGQGIGTGPKRVENASRMALNTLNNHLANARGVLGILRGEQDLSAEDFINASEVLHQHTSPGDWPFIVGLVYDDSVGRQAEVTVLIIEAKQSEIY